MQSLRGYEPAPAPLNTGLLDDTGTHIHTYMPTYLQTDIHAYLRAYVRTYIDTCTRACMHLQTYVDTYGREYIHIYKYTEYVYPQTYMPTHTVSIYLYTHANIHTYIHT